jgi:purine-nucleoside phosphorylase
MVIADHLNFTFRSPAMAATGVPGLLRSVETYDRELTGAALRIADELGIGLSSGVYAGVLGPSYETPAEIRMLSRLGADAVGMSTVPEVLVARSLGMRVLGFSCLTNLAPGLSRARLSHDEVLQVASAASASLIRLLGVLLPRVIPQNLPTEAS